MWVKQAKAERHDFLTALYRLGGSRVAMLLFFVLSSTFMFFLGAYFFQQGTIYGVRDILRQNVRIPLHYLSALGADVPHLSIDVKHKQFQRIAFNRKVALERGGLLPDMRDEVPASLRFDDKLVQAKIRLKGDLPDHWRHESKWSLRIRLRGEETFLGMKQFSIQHPRTRGWLDEWFLHQLLAANNLIAQRYEFVQVSINGKDLGLYGLQEHFEKRLLENNRNREGPLFKADTSFYWYHKPGIASATYGSAVDAYQAGRLAENPALREQFEVARNLFEAFREGDLPTHKVFDLEKLANLHAILELVGSHHAGALDNMALYYNPVTSRLEPAAADAAIVISEHLLGAERRIGGAPSNDWFDLVFSDPLFYTAYIRALERLSAPEYLESFLLEHEAELSRQTRLLHTSFPWFSFDESRQTLEYNRRRIQGFLTPERSLQVYSKGGPPKAGSLILEVATLHSLPIEILAAALPDGTRLVPAEPTLLQPHRSGYPLAYQDLAFVSVHDGGDNTNAEAPAAAVDWTDETWQSVLLEHRILGSSAVREVAVHAGPHRDQSFLEQDFMRRPPNADTFDFLQFDEEKKRILLAPGTWTLSQSLILPAGYRVIAGPGLHLDLQAGATILSFSPLELKGTGDEPILIESSNSAGQGLTVMQAGGASVLEHVHFKNLSGPEQTGWKLTGSVTFFESPVTLSHCRFEAGRSEDALNVIRGEFTLTSSIFENILSDAVDVDFGRGTISDTTFLDIGNDAIDISGTVLEVANVVIDRAGDKGLSAGEASEMKANNITIRQTEIALAAKDRSRIVVAGLEIQNSRVGFTVFQKKPEFGPGAITATGVSTTGVEVDYLVEERSSVSINGQAIQPTHKKVEELLYGAQYGKQSRR